MKDIRRVFEYHGAEHKVVFNFESGQPVNVENAQKFTTFHPRCGTSFLLVVMLISMIVYTLIPFDSFAAKLLVAHCAAAADRRGQLRIDPLRRPAARFVAGHLDRSRPLAAAHHHQAARRCSRPPSPSTLLTAPWRSKKSRAASWSSPNIAGSCNSRNNSSQIEVRFEELTQQLADPAVMSDGDQLPQSRQGP